ncbi:MAG: tRNA pseudouridine(55) synthase TruB [Gemmatimonadales bacterium]
MDKPPGPTSHDVVQRVRRTFGVKAVGHTGTLDPFASGLLVLLVGRATRVARFLDGLRKTYLAVARLGIRTATDDRTGAALGEPADPSALRPEAVQAAVEALVGSHAQRPPAYSAKQVEGVRSYRRARRGETVELPEVRVTVHAAVLLELAGERVTFRVTVSTGTYVRALARDLGERLGVGAHLAELRREAIGALHVGQALPLERLGPDTPLLPLARVLEHLPSLALTDEELADVRHGRALKGRRPGGEAGGGAHLALLAHDDVVAIARDDGELLRPEVVLESA